MSAGLGRRVAACAGGLGLAVSLAWEASAMPTGPAAFCDLYADAPGCQGAQVGCETCHETPPAHNRVGRDLEDVLLPGEPRPLDAETFDAALPEALMAIEVVDSDADGYDNLDEWLAGSDASDPASFPGADVCGEDRDETVWRYDVCDYDARFTLTRVMVDVCGASPSFEALQEVEAASDPKAIIHETLEACLNSEYWRGRDGVLWRLAHAKIRPAAALKAGAEPGDVPLGDYEDDYNLFVYTQLDGRDARELLTAQYHVQREDGPSTTYTAYTRTPTQDVLARGARVAQLTQVERRAGMLTTRWNFVINTMFTPIPRTTAAAAYRSWLGYDIAKMEGLQDVGGEPADYDDKGVDATECAACHATLDPLTYPFSRYYGLGGGAPGRYDADRMASYAGTEGPGILATPEAGSLFGQEVADVLAWGQVAAQSDAFARTLVLDYWTMMLGGPPRPQETAAFTELWSDFASVHGYSVDAMLHDLIDTEAYSVP